MRRRWNAIRGYGLDLDRSELLGFSLFLMFAAVQRGLDYISFPGQDTIGLSSLERSFSLSWWGVIFIALGVVGLTGTALKQWWAVSIAHFVLAVVYGVFAYAYGSDAHISDGGWRTSGDWALVFLPFNLLMANAATRAWRKRSIDLNG